MPHSSRRLVFGLPSVLFFLAGCPAVAPTTPTSSPSGLPSSAPSAAPTAVSPTSSPSSTPAPATVGETALVRGRVYDEMGAAAPDGTAVRIRSMREGVPFEASVTTANGLYVVPDVPVDTQLEISATRTGWTTRKRVEVASRNPNKLESRNVFNFGGENDAADPQGRPFFISTYPEIESVEPLNASTSLVPDQMRVKLTLSEQLDEVNRRRLAAAIRVVPNSKAALEPGGILPAATAPSGELNALFAGPEPANTAAYSYRQNSGFYNGLAQGGVTWSNDNRTVEFSLKAPVKTGTMDEAQYALILVQPDVDPIVDVEGNPLGMDAAGNFGGIVRNQLIRSALPMETPSFSGPASNNKERWRETHKSLITFSYAKDQEKPKLEGVTARRNYSDGSGNAYDRLELTFSEPLIAYPAIVGDQVLSLNNYRIATAPTEAELGNAISSTSTASLVGTGSLVADIRAALKKSSGMAVDSDGAFLNGSEGRFEVTLDPRNPKMVVLHLPAGALPLDANYVKVAVRPDERAAGGSGNGVSDPAGNPMDPQADAQLGSIN